VEQNDIAINTLRFLQKSGARKKLSGDKRTDAEAKAGKKAGRGKDQRTEDVKAAKAKKQTANQEKTKKAKETNTKLKKGQAKCFKRVFKFGAGMMCLACDANYADIVSTAADGTIQIKIQSKSCDNLMKNCYSYIEARDEAAG